MPSTCWRRRERDARDRCARRRARRHGRRHGLWALHSGRRRRLPAGRGAPAPGPKGAPLQGAGDAARALRRPPRARPAARRTARGRPTRSGDRRRCELEPRQRGDGAEGRRDAAGGQRPRRQPARCAERLEQRRRKHSRDLVSLRRAEPDGLLGRDLRPRRDRARVAPPAGRTREPRRRRRRRAGRRGRAVAPGRRACRRGRARARARGASRLWRAPVRGACSTGAASDRPRRRLLRGARSPPDGHRRGPGLGRRAERHGRLRRPRRPLAGAWGEEGRRVTTTAQPTTTVVTGRPRYEGANIRTWIGFKHFVYLVEEAVLHWFRERDLGARRLYHDFGLGLELVDVSVQLPAYLEVDDEVTAAVSEERLGRLSVRLSVDRDGTAVPVLNGKVAVALVQEEALPGRVPDELAGLVVPGSAAAATAEPRDLEPAPGGVEATFARLDPQPFVWSWRARYFHCHFSDRVQHSAYVRALEEVVDRFLADRGLAIPRLLAERGWIPVVSRARVQVIADAHMDEVVHTTFVVEDVLRGLAYDARMDCYVERDGRLVHTATAKILHGYAGSAGEEAGRVVELDAETIAALTGAAQ